MVWSEYIELKYDSDIYNCLFDPFGKNLAFESNKEIILWNKDKTTTLNSTESINSLSFHPNGNILASSSGLVADLVKLELWDVEKEEIIKVLKNDKYEDAISPIDSIIFNSSGDTLISGSDDGEIILWDIEYGTKLISFREHNDCINSMALDPINNIIFSGSDDKTIKLRDLRSWKNITTFEGHSNIITSLDLQRNGYILASGSYDKTINLWDIRNGNELATIEETSGISSVAFHPSENILTGGINNGKIQFWNTQNIYDIKKICTLPSYGIDGPNFSAIPLSFNPSGNILASGSAIGTVKIWKDVGRLTKKAGGSYKGSCAPLPNP